MVSNVAASIALTVLEYLRAVLEPLIGLATHITLYEYKHALRVHSQGFSAGRAPPPPRCLDGCSPTGAGCVHTGEPSQHQALLHGFCLSMSSYPR